MIMTIVILIGIALLGLLAIGTVIWIIMAFIGMLIDL